MRTIRPDTNHGRYFRASEAARNAALMFVKSATLQPVGEGAAKLQLEAQGHRYTLVFGPDGRVTATASFAEP